MVQNLKPSADRILEPNNCNLSRALAAHYSAELGEGVWGRHFWLASLVFSFPLITSFKLLVGAQTGKYLSLGNRNCGSGLWLHRVVVLLLQPRLTRFLVSRCPGFRDKVLFPLLEERLRSRIAV